MRQALFGIALALFGFALAGCSGGGADDNFEKNYNEAKVKGILRSMETGDVSPIEKYVSADTYIQHNYKYSDGRQAAIDAIKRGEFSGSRVQVWRIFTDGDLIVTHTEYELSGVPRIGFDVFRLVDGYIVEHWNNLQDRIEPTASGRGMIDGTLAFTDDERTADNKALVEDFVRSVLINGQIERMAEFFDGDTLYQHSPDVAEGVSGYTQALSDRAQQGTSHNYKTLRKVIGEGNYVLAMSEGDISGTPTAFYDLFRIQSGKLVEHWDTVETIPPANEWMNGNGKF